MIAMSLRSKARSTINQALSKSGLQLVRTTDLHDWSDTGTFIPLTTTVENAKRAGLSVGDYIDTVMNKIPGATQKTIDDMSSLGVFSKPIHTVVEVGPGSGRYAQKTIDACRPSPYEVYETAEPWAQYVREHYDVVLQPTDGRTLKATPNNSADLIQAHKVFSGIPFLPTCSYWVEMARVARAGAHVVFDLITERCLDMAMFHKWVQVDDEGLVDGIVR